MTEWDVELYTRLGSHVQSSPAFYLGVPVNMQKDLFLIVNGKYIG